MRNLTLVLVILFLQTPVFAEERLDTVKNFIQLSQSPTLIMNCSFKNTNVIEAQLKVYQNSGVTLVSALALGEDGYLESGVIPVTFEIGDDKRPAAYINATFGMNIQILDRWYSDGEMHSIDMYGEFQTPNAQKAVLKNGRYRCVRF